MKNTKQEILDKLFELQRFGIKPGLERTVALLSAVGNPHKGLKTIHVAGTNGKGSVCSMTASVLTSAGYKTGLYTSPHIVDFNERIRINGVKISDEELIKYSELLLPYAESIGCTFFEITTVMAFLHFSENAVDFAVIETGMGGRFDSTSVLQPLVSVITNIGLDHQEYLGNTIGEIAFEKAGILKAGVPAVIGIMPDEAINIIAKHAREIGSPLFLINEDYSYDITSWNPDFSMKANAKTKTKFYRDLNIPFAGEHQKGNTLIALQVMEIIGKKYVIPEKSIYQGLSKTKQNTGISSRIELLKEKPPIVVDVAHNPEAISSLVDTLSKCGYHEKWNIVFASMSDKDYGTSIHLLSKISNSFFFTSLDIPRAVSAEILKEIAHREGFENIRTFEDSDEAVKTALSYNLPTLIVGSFYLIGEVSSFLSNEITLSKSVSGELQE